MPSANSRRNIVRQPSVSQQVVIALAIEIQLAMMSQSRIHLTILIRIRCWLPAATDTVQEEGLALPHIEKEADWVVTSSVILAFIVRII